MEPISKVKSLNGESISADCHLVKADFSSSDEMVIRFRDKDYCGVVDLSRDDDTVKEWENSPQEQFPCQKSPSKSPLPVYIRVVSTPVRKK